MKKEKIVKRTKDCRKGKLKGLCINCDNRHDCMFLNENRPVIYCEEYAQYCTQISKGDELESIEFVVEEMEDIGGAGVNFIVEWATPIYYDQFLIQALMVRIVDYHF